MEQPELSSPGPLPGGAADPDPEWAQYLERLNAEIAGGRDPEPEVWAAEAADPGSVNPEFTGPGSAGPEFAGPAWPRFGQGDEADVLPPGPLLVSLTEAAANGLGRLSDNELVGLLQATRRQIAREQYKQVLVTAEFGRRRRAAFQDAARRGIPVGCRPGGFPGEELAIELVTTTAEAGHRIDDAIDLTTRLPMTLAGLAAGQIDEPRAGWIAMYTRSLTPADAALADEVLAWAAPDLREEQLARKAACLEKRLNPEGVAARREHAKRNEQRVEARRELSGNASLSGRELATADVMAGKAHIDAIAVKLRNSGLIDGTLDRLRALTFTDLTQGRNPLDRIKLRDSGLASDGSKPRDSSPLRPAPAQPADGDGEPGRASARPGDKLPLPALVNLLVPVGSLFGWSAAPGQAGAWGILDRDETRAVVSAVAQHPRTRWCVTLTAPDGTALAHACARGQHAKLLDDLEPQPPPAKLAELLHRLNLVFSPIAADSCDHAQAEDHYTPSRKLKHLVRARTATCDAPGCSAQAISTDLDHTTPWPDGQTEQCNLAPRCRTHHRAKQAPDWKVEQVGPGVTRWTLPSGRTHVTTPTQYDT
jgi:hypothetical protein